MMTYNTDRLLASFHSFAEKMEESTQLKDGFLTARIIGEFSAGKTRLLRELLGDAIPPALFPVSSIERQTKLPLEITYGDQVELTLVEREADYRPAVTLKTLTRFPERHEIDSAFVPTKHRLRLALPIRHFILPQGDGMQAEKTPMRLFLIDTPGWNSGDDDIAEADASNIMAGYHNLGLVYVTDARRLDGNTNTERLRDFLEVLQDAEFLQGAHLLFVITHCGDNDQVKLTLRAKQRVMDLWTSLHNDPETLTLNILCVEFDGMNQSHLQNLRDTFWQILLAPLGEQKELLHPWIDKIHHWPKDWYIQTKINETIQLVANAHKLFDLAFQKDEFLVGMNMYRLIGLNDKEIRKKLSEAWLRQLGCNEISQLQFDVDKILLPVEHPLFEWWNNFWIENVKISLDPIQFFFKKAHETIHTVHDKTEDLKKHLADSLAESHKAVAKNMDNSFFRLLDTAKTLVEETSSEKVLATLFNLSLLQARYEDYYATHLKEHQHAEGL